ncbi:MAG: hypothetical protein FWG88_08685 [Oscillospiraceae bacterium]|nr:hypothetical protein [Oscillospiraceae bacterium]
MNRIKKRARILRIRPFNMANFSGAGGYIPLIALFGWIVSLPATLSIWTGTAIGLDINSNEINLNVIKTRLLKLVLPFSIIAAVFWIIFCVIQISSYGNSLLIFILIIWTLLIHTIGVYFPIYLSAKILDNMNRLTKAKWFMLMFLFSAVMVVVSICGTYLLIDM